MEKIAWDDKFNIGVDIIDKAHAKLFRIIHKLIDLSNDPSTTKRTCQEMLKYLETYSMAHYAEEETYMRSIHYSGYAQHKRSHDNFRDKTLVSLKKDLELSNYSLSAVQHLIGALQSWLAEHILKADQAIVKKVPRESYDFSSQAVLISKAVNRASQDLFLTEMKLINTDYKGENIGNAFYCHQTYDIEGGIQLRLLLGIEEPLFRRGLEKFYGKRSVKALAGRPPASEALLPVFRQFFGHMGKFFQSKAEHELDRKNLLDTDEFRTDFMKGYPCRMLFGSKSGYFIFCYRTRRVKNN